MKKFTIFTAATILAAAATSLTGCDDKNNPIGDIASQCGFSCDSNALVNGQTSISGIANIDAFYAQVANFNATATLVGEGLAAPLVKIKAQLGLPSTATGADVAAAMKTQFQLDSAVTIDYAPPTCQISAKATVEATAKCDASVSAGSVKASCEGRCDADVQVSGGQVSCSGSAKLQCTAPSAKIACSGSCKGECTVTAGAECTGSCSGTCNGTCDGTCDGKATGGAAAAACSGKCEGKCTGGTCTGKCNMTAGGTCNGTCTGDCSVEATGGSCAAGAKMECFVEPPSTSASVQCEGKCEGSIEPPQASVQCQASAKAEASMKAECTPPSIDITAKVSATADASVSVKYDAFLEVFKSEMGNLVANLQRSDIVVKAGAELIGSVPSVLASFKTAAAGAASGDLKLAAGLTCAATLVPQVPDILGTGVTTLSGQITAATSFVAAFK
jgi:hypothetical protein